MTFVFSYNNFLPTFSELPHHEVAEFIIGFDYVNVGG